MKKYGFIAVSILLGITILLALPGKNSFEYSAPQMAQEILKRTYIVSVSKYKEIKMGGSMPVLLADIRKAADYESGHLPDAISIPFEGQDLASLYDFVNKHEGYVFLYAEQTSTACEWWILLTQMGMENIYVLETGPDLSLLIRDWPDRNESIIMHDEIPGFTFMPDTSLRIL
jgi:rhodanese-related sulfurtransferase